MDSSWLSLCFLLLLLHGSIAQRTGQEACRFERLNPQEAKFREESEGGFTEYFDQRNEQFQCAGVSAYRRTTRPRSLLLPSYSNSPRLVYMLQGQTICGVLIPGCPETFQSFQQRSGHAQPQSSRRPDQHQKIHQFRQGDIMALPAGVAYWCYNDRDDSSAVAITVLDTSNNPNDPNPREFLLAGSQKTQGQQQQQEEEEFGFGDSIFKGLDTQLIADSFGVSTEIAQRLQETQKKGRIVKVDRSFQVVQPQRRDEEESESESEREHEKRQGMNGIEQSFCNFRFKENIDRPERADVYNPNGGRLTTLNVLKLPILQFIQMSAFRGVLYQDAIHTPHWDSNAHTVMYVTKGRGQVQIVGEKGKSIFNGELREGQLILVPQNFLVVKRARSERFEWVSFKTNGTPIQNNVAGEGSVFRAMPLDVISNSYSRLSRDEAYMLKFNTKDQHGIITPRSQQGRAKA